MCKRLTAALLIFLLWPLTPFPACALAQPRRVVSLLGSFAEAWVLAGGDLVGVTEDAVSERDMALDWSVQIIGATKNPNLELVLDLEPDLVLYSTELSGQQALAQTLNAMGIPALGYGVTSYQDYMAMMEQLCALTGRSDLYAGQREAVSQPIAALMEKARRHPQFGKRTALLLRAYSTGVRAKGADNLAGRMLEDMGLVNIAHRDGTLLESLTLEAILEADPDYIFAVTMGESQEKALAALAETLTVNPAWQGLTAVKEGRFILLDRSLFHLKPNARWAQAYQYLYDLLYEDKT